MPAQLTIVVPGLGLMGGQRVLYEWANRSAAEGITTSIVSPEDGPGLDLLNPAVRTLIPSQTRASLLHSRMSAKLGHDVALMRRRAARLRGHIEGEAIVLGYLPLADAMSEVAGPFVSYAQHWEPLWAQTRAGTRYMQNRMAAGASVIVNSSWLEERLPAADRPVTKVFPGVATEVFRPAVVPPVRRGCATVVALGREDVDWKGVRDLRHAMGRVDAGPVQLLLFGTKDRQVVRHPWGEEHQLGSLDHAELTALYQRATVVACPSWHESFPLPPLEAMACGAAVVTTGPGTEDYAVDDLNSLVVGPKDPEALAVAIGQLITDRSLAQRLGEAGRATAEAFTWERGHAQFLQAVGLA